MMVLLIDSRVMRQRRYHFVPFNVLNITTATDWASTIWGSILNILRVNLSMNVVSRSTFNIQSFGQIGP